MTIDPMHGFHPSPAALLVYAHLHRRGSMRLKPLLRGLRMDPRVFTDAVFELAERYWIRVEWRKAAPDACSYTDIERLRTTRFGRRKYRAI